MLQASTLKFLKDLKRNNNKPWFESHRSAYEMARKDFEQFIQAVIDEQGKRDADIRGQLAKACMFRINRDVRFSKDKSPYKSNMGASMIRNGKKSIYAGYYFHLEPGQAFAGGGIWMPRPEDLKKIRQEIDYNLPAFKKIIGSKNFKAVYGELDKSKEFTLSRVPKGYEPNNPAAEFLKMKCYIATANLKDTDVTAKDLVKKTVKAFQALQPLLQFINNSLE